MAKKLRDIVNPNQSKGDKDFIKLHGKKITADKNGNGDDVFDATNVKTADYPKSEQADANEETIPESTEEKEKLRDMIAKKTAGVKVTKVPESEHRDDKLNASWRVADRPKENKRVDNIHTPSKKTYLKTWKKSFAKEEKQEEEISESVSEDQYSLFHKRCLKSLANISSSLTLHQKYTKGQWGGYEIKDLSRTLEDIEANIAQSTEYKKPYKPSTANVVK